MCGIAGFWNITGTLLGDNARVARQMAAAIHHRGPDESGIWYEAPRAPILVHARLAVLELSPAGSQPMHSDCGRYVLIYNGEIYNHLALRARLSEAGVTHSWRGGSDTETLLACFAQWGVESTLKLTVGMFALALWDRQEKTITLARDRMGEKPLYWGWQNGVLFFASELKALKEHPLFRGDIDRDALALFLRYGYVPAPYSIYKGIGKLRAGSYLVLSERSLNETCEPAAYWSANAAIEEALSNPFQGTDAEAVDLLESQLRTSISDQMVSDVPLGAFLSGGVDSSTVVALMQQQSSRPIRTFSIGFDEPGYDEAVYAKAVAEHIGTDHTELYVNSKDALDVIPSLPKIYCEPFGDSSQIPTLIVSGLARQQVTVALSGDGGDELFGGYNPYQFTPRVWRMLERFPHSMRRFASAFAQDLPLPEKLGKLRDVFASRTAQELFYRLNSHWRNHEYPVIGAQGHTALLDTPERWPRVDSFQHWMMAMDVQGYMPDDILVKVDRAAMANSLETRVPLIDHRVFELAWRMPLHMKIRNGKGKWLLREVLYRHVSRELIERPKKGFSVPVSDWLRGPLKEWAESLLDERRLQQEGYLDSRLIRRIWNDHLAGRRDHSRRLWSVLMFQAWLES
ncbi:asparagine synthase (glutamine-hydrolyzing) [Pseudomonas aeruginosa]